VLLFLSKTVLAGEDAALSDGEDSHTLLELVQSMFMNNTQPLLLPTFLCLQDNTSQESQPTTDTHLTDTQCQPPLTLTLVSQLLLPNVLVTANVLTNKTVALTTISTVFNVVNKRI
jgi:hypothetical protein